MHVTEVVEASLYVISQTLMDACTKTEHKLSRVSPLRSASGSRGNFLSWLRSCDQLSPLLSC